MRKAIIITLYTLAALIVIASSLPWIGHFRRINRGSQGIRFTWSLDNPDSQPFRLQVDERPPGIGYDTRIMIWLDADNATQINRFEPPLIGDSIDIKKVTIKWDRNTQSFVTRFSPTMSVIVTPPPELVSSDYNPDTSETSQTPGGILLIR